MIYCLFVISLVFSSTLALADTADKLKKMQLPNNRVITVTGHPDYPPVVWQKKDSRELIGISVELLQKVFAEANIKVEVINTDTWGRAQVEVAKGNVDMLMPPYKNAEREKAYKYSKYPFLMDDTVIFVKKEKTFKFNKLHDLVGKRGVAITHDSFGTTFDSFAEKKLSLHRLPKTEHCFKFLLKDRADYMVAGYTAGLAVAATMDILEEVDVLHHRIIVTGMYLPISLASSWNIPEVHNFLEKRIQQLTSNGHVKKLESKYLNIFKNEKRPFVK